MSITTILLLTKTNKASSLSPINITQVAENALNKAIYFCCHMIDIYYILKEKCLKMCYLGCFIYQH